MKKLPLDCDVVYHESFLKADEANKLFAELESIIKEIAYLPQKEDGSNFLMSTRKVMFLPLRLMEENAFPEEIWGPTKVYTNTLEALRKKIEHHTGHKFEVCVLIYYPDGYSGVGFHSDFPAFGDTSIIPSVSLGEERSFALRNKESALETNQLLKNGSLIVMGEHCQERYEHSLPENPECKNPRINLTFRKYGYDKNIAIKA